MAHVICRVLYFLSMSRNQVIITNIMLIIIGVNIMIFRTWLNTQYLSWIEIRASCVVLSTQLIYHVYCCFVFRSSMMRYHYIWPLTIGCERPCETLMEIRRRTGNRANYKDLLAKIDWLILPCIAPLNKGGYICDI